MAVRARPHPRPLVTGGVRATAATIGAYAVLHRLGSTSGSTTQERERALPGDDLIPQPSAIVPADHVMTRGMFRGLGERVSA